MQTVSDNRVNSKYCAHCLILKQVLGVFYVSDKRASIATSKSGVGVARQAKHPAHQLHADCSAEILKILGSNIFCSFLFKVDWTN
jgi:hypothetical protein